MPCTRVARKSLRRGEARSRGRAHLAGELRNASGHAVRGIVKQTIYKRAKVEKVAGLTRGFGKEGQPGSR
eukprot:6465972-Heterocapsa_arctica.AAC.1